MAVTDGNSNHNIHIYRTTDGRSWCSYNFTNKTDLVTENQPALAVFDNKLWLSGRGSISTSAVFITSSDDGLTWSNANRVKPGGTNLESSAGPALEVFNNNLFLAASGLGGDNQIYLTSSADGSTWATESAVRDDAFDFGGTPGRTAKAPAMAVYGGQLFLGASSSTLGNVLIWTRSHDGVNFLPWSVTEATASTGPDLEVFNDRLWAIVGPDIQVSQHIGDALPSANLVGTVLSVFGSADDDDISLLPDIGGIEVFINGFTFGTYSGVTSVNLLGRGGNDTILANDGIANTPVVLVGGAGRDTLTGDAGGTRVFYNDGNDTESVADGSDVQIINGRWSSDQALSPGQNAGDFNLVFTPIPGHDHQVVYTDDLSSGVWTELVDGPGGGNTGNVVDNTSGPSRIYQIIATPQR